MKKFILIIVCNLTMIAGCTSFKEANKDEVLVNKYPKADLEIYSTNGDKYYFKAENYYFLNDTLVEKGIKYDSTSENDFDGVIAKNNIAEVKESGFNFSATGLLVGSALLVLILYMFPPIWRF